MTSELESGSVNELNHPLCYELDLDFFTFLNFKLNHPLCYKTKYSFYSKYVTMA